MFSPWLLLLQLSLCIVFLFSSHYGQRSSFTGSWVSPLLLNDGWKWASCSTYMFTAHKTCVLAVCPPGKVSFHQLHFKGSTYFSWLYQSLSCEVKSSLWTFFFFNLITAELPMRAVTHSGNPDKADVESSEAKLMAMLKGLGGIWLFYFTNILHKTCILYIQIYSHHYAHAGPVLWCNLL